MKSQAGNFNSLHESHIEFVFNVPKGEKADTKTSQDERFDRFGAPQFNQAVQLPHTQSAILEYAFHHKLGYLLQARARLRAGSEGLEPT